MPHVDSFVDSAFAMRIVEGLASIGSSELGFRVAGTSEDDAVCSFVAEHMRAIGLQGVRLEPVPVDAWSFRGASLAVGSDAFECSSFGGVEGTPPGGVEGEIVFAGEGTRRELESIDVAGRIALFDWRGDQLFWPALTAAELGRAGAVGAVCTCLPGSRYYQAERALGSFDAIGLAGSPPLAYLRKEDAALVIDRLRGGAAPARLVIDTDLVRGATAHNIIGVLPGRSERSPIVIGGHHDCWFAAAFDDATGVAATLAIAKALVDAGYEPEHPIIFTSHTAEEYGRADSAFDWLIGAWWQIAHEHPEWQQEALLYVNVEGTGMACPTAIDAPPELRRFARSVAARARRDGLLRHGVAWGVPRTGTEQWPFAAAGVPSLGVADEVWDYMRTKYHTQYDDLSLVDPGFLGEAIKFYARLVIAADRNPAALLDLAARPRQLRRHGGLRALVDCGVDTRRLAAALDGHEAAAGGGADLPSARRAFHATSTAIEGLNAYDKQDLSHRQAITDVVALTSAARLLRRGRRAEAIIALERVGRNALTARLSESVFAHDAARHRDDHPGINWAAGHLTPSPNLWAELASLREEPGARPAGDWIADSVEAARVAAAEHAQARVECLADAFEHAARVLSADA